VLPKIFGVGECISTIASEPMDLTGQFDPVQGVSDSAAALQHLGDCPRRTAQSSS
jgi:hypothetical protein